MNIRDEIAEHAPEAMLMDGYDDCIVGYVEQFGRPPIVAYDLDKLIQRHQDDGMTED